MENKDYKKKVLEFLKDTEKSTSEISSLLSRDFYFTLRLLEEMKEENLLEKIEIKNFNYWKIKNGKEI